MVYTQENMNKSERKYKLVPPEGGWGHLITASVTVMNLVTIVPTAAFGLLYGNFLASIGDETTGTALTTGIYNTVQSFTGLAANYLLQKYSYRKVGLLGAAIHIIGAFASIFVTNLTQLIISFGILQGMGFGLMTPASFSAFICYFDKKLTFMMCIAQAIMVLAAILYPPIIAILVEYFGFRGGAAFLAALALLCIPAMGVLHPVKWHMKKVPIQPNQIIANNKVSEKSKSLTGEVLKAQIQPLLSKQLEEDVLANSLDLSPKHNTTKFRDDFKDSKPRVSIISLGNKALSVTTVNDLEGEELRKPASTSMDLSLLKDLKYLNITCGISLSYTSDAAFITIIPLILNNIGFSKTDIAQMMMVHFGFDFLSRIIISIVTAVCTTVSNRYLFLVGSFLSAIFRIAFVLYDTYMWKVITLGVLGSLRCLIQNPLALVISEEYSDNFSTAFSLYMVVCGFVSLVFGPLMSFVKSVTQSDVMVVHLLTVAYLICSISWTIELLWKRITRKESDRNIGTTTSSTQ